MYKGLCVINMKGGVGKTTIAVNLAWAAARKGLKALVVDLDPQFNASVYLMGGNSYINYIRQGGLTVFDIFEEHTPLRDPQRPRPTADNVIYRHIRRWRGRAFPHVIPSQLELAATLKNPAGKAHLLSTFLSQQASDYDLIVVDPPPTDSMATEAAYLATNYILVPIKPEFLSSIGFPLLERSVNSFRRQYPNHSLDVVGLCLQNVDRKLREYDRTKDDTRRFAESQGWRFLDQEISYSLSYQHGSRAGTPIFSTDHARGYRIQEFLRLADEVFSSMGL